MINECQIVKELPQGGQKSVHLAQHPTLGQVVIKRGTIKSFISLERIRREVDLLSELESEYYPKQYHFNIDVKAKEFEIVEAYIEGKSLRDSMTQFKQPYDIFLLLNWLIVGLSVIWSKNIVHRDLKPENIIIRPNGIPCIIDLGIARFLDMESLTKTMSPFGPCTPIYASPEQLTNNKNMIDIRSDFYCLGILALELFLGVHPFDPTYLKNNFSIVENILQNLYIVKTENQKENSAITILASRTLRLQPFERFRTYQILQSFIQTQL